MYHTNGFTSIVEIRCGRLSPKMSGISNFQPYWSTIKLTLHKAINWFFLIFQGQFSRHRWNMLWCSSVQPCRSIIKTGLCEGINWLFHISYKPFDRYCWNCVWSPPKVVWKSRLSTVSIHNETFLHTTSNVSWRGLFVVDV